MAPNFSKSSLLKDDKNLKAYSQLKTVVEMDPTLKEKVQIPVLVITGVQSAGKTSLIEAMVGFPVGFTDREVGTRCPVRYILRHGAEMSWAVGGVQLTKPEDVRDKVTEHMKGLQKNDIFAQEALIVQICGPDLQDMDITDLPGLQVRGETTASTIAAIAKQYFTEPNVIPVAVCKAAESHMTQLDVEVLEDVGFDANRGLLVVNRFNHQIGGMHKASTFNKYCQGFFKKFKNVFFVMLHYKDEIDKDDMTFAEAQQYYSSLAENENKVFKEKISKLERAEPDVKVTEDVKNSLGIDAALGAMQGVLSTWMDRNRQGIVSSLQEKFTVLSQKQTTLEDFLKGQKPEHLQMIWDDYISEWQKVMNGVYEAKHNYVTSHPRRTSVYAKTFDWAFDPEDPSLVHTFDEEWEWIPAEIKQRARFFASPDDLRLQLAGTALGKLLDARLHPHAAFLRMGQVMDYVIMTYPMRPLTEDEVLSKNGHSKNGVCGRFDKHSVIKDLITERLFEIQDIVEVALNHIEGVYEAPCERVHQLLEDRHPAVACHKGFKEEMSRVYKQLLQNQLLKANSILQEMVKMNTSLVPVDLPTRLISLLGLAPLRQDILKLEADVFEDEMDVSQDPSPQSSSEGKKWISSNNVAQRQNNTNILESVRQHRKAVIEVKKTLHKVGPMFKFVDFVEGGCQDFVAEERRCINVEELNKEGEQYFVLLKGLISLYNQNALNYHVYSFLSNELLAGMERSMRDEIRKITMAANAEDGIRKMIGGGQDEQKAELEKVKVELESVKECLKHLDACESQPASSGMPFAQLAGGRPTPSPSRAELSVRGDLEFQVMDLTKLPQMWQSQFCGKAEEDIAAIVGVQRHRVTASIAGEVLKYKVKVDDPEQKTAMRRQIEGGRVLPRAAALYCTCLNLPGGEQDVAKIGAMRGDSGGQAASPGVDQAVPTTPPLTAATPKAVPTTPPLTAATPKAVPTTPPLTAATPKAAAASSTAPASSDYLKNAGHFVCGR